MLQVARVGQELQKPCFTPCKVKQASFLEAAQSAAYHKCGEDAGFRACTCSEVHEAGKVGLPPDLPRDDAPVWCFFVASPPLLSSYASSTQYDMSKHPTTRPYRLYPAYCFRSSPTYDAWVKLTAADVHALRTEPDFRGRSGNSIAK